MRFEEIGPQPEAPRPGVNPHGGGGDQFIHLYVVRQGKYGMHSTLKGKTVYRRPRHYFNSKDLERILPKVAEEEEKVEGDFTWWQKLINWAAEYMINKMASIINLNEDITSLVWSTIMGIWWKFLKKVSGTNSLVENSIRLYENRTREALDSYLKSGDTSLLEALADDLIGGN